MKTDNTTETNAATQQQDLQHFVNEAQQRGWHVLILAEKTPAKGVLIALPGEERILKIPVDAEEGAGS